MKELKLQFLWVLLRFCLFQWQTVAISSSGSQGDLQKGGWCHWIKTGLSESTEDFRGCLPNWVTYRVAPTRTHEVISPAIRPSLASLLRSHPCIANNDSYGNWRLQPCEKYQGSWSHSMAWVGPGEQNVGKFSRGYRDENFSYDVGFFFFTASRPQPSCHMGYVFIMCTCYNASQSSSSHHGSHKSLFDPKPFQWTRYCIPHPHPCLSTIFLIAYSSIPLVVTTGPSQVCSQEGNSLASFVWKCLSINAWKVGNMLGEFSRSKV